MPSMAKRARSNAEKLDLFVQAVVLCLVPRKVESPGGVRNRAEGGARRGGQ